MKTKSYLYSILASSAMMMLSGCSQNEFADQPTAGGKSTTVTFAVNAPAAINTRAYADGNTATELQYAVYDENGTLLSGFGTPNGVTETMTGKQTTVKLQLVKGNSYKVVFLATSTSAPYAIDWAAKTLKYNDALVIANNEAADAFYKAVDITVTANEQQTVTLTRPFAQLNIGTDDMSSSITAGFTPSSTQVSLSGVPSSMNLLDGSVSGSQTLKLTYNAIPAAEDFPVDKTKYKYLAMGYVLMGDKQTTDVTFDFKDATGKEFQRSYSAVPLQRNYRTNIYGSLLTNTVDYTVKIDPAWDGDYSHPVIEAHTQAEFVQAAQAANAIVKLEDATTFTLPEGSGTIADGVTIVGGTGTVMETKASLNGGEGNYNAQNLNNVTFKNLTIKEGNGNYNGIKHSDNLTYEDCIIEGQPFSFADHVTYNHCTFKQTSSGAYKIWTYGTQFLTFNNCAFECAGKAALVYKEGGTTWMKITFNDCTFTASAKVTGKAAIEIDSSLNPFEVYINNCTATGFDNGSKSGNSLWNNKKGDNTNLKVFVDGVAQPLN